MSLDIETPDNFPYGVKNKKIKSVIKEVSDKLIDQRRISHKAIDPGVVAYRTALIQIGQSELQGRFSKRLARLTVLISIVSLLVAIYSIIKTNDNIKSSQEWKDAQLKVLNELKEKVSFLENKKVIMVDTIVLKTDGKPISSN